MTQENDIINMIKVVLRGADVSADAHVAMESLGKAAKAGNTTANGALAFLRDIGKSITYDPEHSKEAALAALGALELNPKAPTSERVAKAIEIFRTTLHEHKMGHDHHHDDHEHEHHSGPTVPKRDPEKTSWVQEVKGQAADRWAEKGVMGKMGIVAGSAVGLGVVIHGLHNVKRGVVGYTDKETGEKRDPAVSNLIFGLTEVAGGAMLAKRMITGQYGFKPAPAR